MPSHQPMLQLINNDSLAMQSAVRWALYILGVELLFLISFRAGQLALVFPLAATCVLLAANPSGQFAHPRTVLLAYGLVGHLGLLNSVFFGNDMFCLLVTVLLAVALMAAVSCIHPPAVSILFLLANAAHPFQSYLILIALTVGLLGFHFTVQWLHTQIFQTREPYTLPLNEPKPANLPTLFTAVKNG